jgi:hypothetical protein
VEDHLGDLLDRFRNYCSHRGNASGRERDKVHQGIELVRVGRNRARCNDLVKNGRRLALELGEGLLDCAPILNVFTVFQGVEVVFEADYVWLCFIAMAFLPRDDVKKPITVGKSLQEQNRRVVVSPGFVRHMHFKSVEPSASATAR